MRERALLLRWKQDENISAIFDLGDSRFWVWAGLWKSWAPPEHCWHDASPYMLLYGPNWAKFGPSLGQIGPKQPIFKVETRDFGSLYVFENTHHYQCIHKIIWAYTSKNLGQVDQNWAKCWAKMVQSRSMRQQTFDFNQVKLPIKIGTSIHLGSFGPIGLNFGPTIDQTLVHLTQIFTGVSSNNLMYVLVVVSILKNVQ